MNLVLFLFSYTVWTIFLWNLFLNKTTWLQYINSVKKTEITIFCFFLFSGLPLNIFFFFKLLIIYEGFQDLLIVVMIFNFISIIIYGFCFLFWNNRNTILKIKTINSRKLLSLTILLSSFFIFIIYVTFNKKKIKIYL